ncbi:MAG TPA: iron ABC transporter substrate-binding protein [Miltoncostaeaceae bacterium]|nr:iron ABC transporter substrate-binding protein [Miltoncostaeaceae bacterium]
MRAFRRGGVPAMAVAALLVAILAASGCGGDRDALTIYSGRTEDLVGPLLERFSEEQGVPIDVRYGDTPQLALLLAEEGDRTPADVFWGQSPGATAHLAQRDLLAPLSSETLGLVNPRFEDPQGLWTGTSGRQRVLVYNSETVAQDGLPRSVHELTRPEYRGRVGIAPTNGSFQDFVTAMRDIEGEEATAAWLRGMADNGARTYANNNAIVEAVGRGEIDMGLVNHYYNHRFLQEDPSLPSRNHRFEDGDIGGLLIPSSASVLAASDKKEEAEAFIRFLLSKEAQEYFADETFEYPLAQGVPPAEGVPPLESLRPPDEPPARLGDVEGTARLIQESGLE